MGVELGIAIIGVFSASGAAAAAAGGIAGVLAGALGGAIIGAAVGGLTSAVMGGDIGKGMLYGAVGGAVLGGVSGYAGVSGVESVGTSVGDIGLKGSEFYTAGGAGEFVATAAPVIDVAGGVIPEVATAGLTAGEGALAAAGLKGVAGLFGGAMDDSAEIAKANREAAAAQSEINARDRLAEIRLQGTEGRLTNADTAALNQKTIAENIALRKQGLGGVLDRRVAEATIERTDTGTGREFIEDERRVLV